VAVLVIVRIRVAVSEIVVKVSGEVLGKLRILVAKSEPAARVSVAVRVKDMADLVAVSDMAERLSDAVRRTSFIAVAVSESDERLSEIERKKV